MLKTFPRIFWFLLAALSVSAHARSIPGYLWSDSRGFVSPSRCHAVNDQAPGFLVSLPYLQLFSQLPGQAESSNLNVMDLRTGAASVEPSNLFADASPYVIQVNGNDVESVLGPKKTKVRGTFWQIAQVNGKTLSWVCGSGVYTVFNVFTKTGPTPFAQVGVQPEETAIFASTGVLTADGANEIAYFANKKTGGAVTGTIPMPRARPSGIPATVASSAQPAVADSPDRELRQIHQAAPWHRLGSLSWTEEALKVIRARKHDLEKAEDLETFCPGYHNSSSKLQDICWIRIVGGVMQYESGFHPNTSLLENDGSISVGLMQVSPPQCPNARSVQALKNPERNIECGVNLMANLIAKSRWISGPSHRGAAVNWSTLRTHYSTYVRSLNKTVSVGFKSQILHLAMQFKNY